MKWDKNHSKIRIWITTISLQFNTHIDTLYSKWSEIKVHTSFIVMLLCHSMLCYIIDLIKFYFLSRLKEI